MTIRRLPALVSLAFLTSAVLATGCSVLAPGVRSKATFFTDGSNPIVKTRFSPDPAAFVDGDWLYLVTGHDDPTARDYKMRDWYMMRTRDMRNWQDFGPVMSVRETFSWAREDKAWASQVIKRNGKWY